MLAIALEHHHCVSFSGIKHSIGWFLCFPIFLGFWSEGPEIISSESFVMKNVMFQIEFIKIEKKLHYMARGIFVLKYEKVQIQKETVLFIV